jgi:hypothetical protein
VRPESPPSEREESSATSQAKPFMRSSLDERKAELLKTYRRVTGLFALTCGISVSLTIVSFDEPLYAADLFKDLLTVVGVAAVVGAVVYLMMLGVVKAAEGLADRRRRERGLD